MLLHSNMPQMLNTTDMCDTIFQLTLPQCWHCLLALDSPGISHDRHARRRRQVWHPNKQDTHCLQIRTDQSVTGSTTVYGYNQLHPLWTYQQAFLLVFQRFPSELQPIEMSSQPSCSHYSPYLWSIQTVWYLQRYASSADICKDGFTKQ